MKTTRESHDANHGRPLRALVVSYSFPPVGGAGVARVTKLTKFLPEHGVTPAVLTVSNPSVPLIDTSRERDVPTGTEVVRVRTFEPGYGAKKVAWRADAGGAPTVKQRATRFAAAIAKQLLVPDPQVLWQPAAQATLARRMLGRDRDDVVFISGPPFSQFLLALTARARGAAVVLDYRDEWHTYRHSYEMMGSLGAKVGDPMEDDARPRGRRHHHGDRAPSARTSSRGFHSSTPRVSPRFPTGTTPTTSPRTSSGRRPVGFALPTPARCSS